MRHPEFNSRPHIDRSVLRSVVTFAPTYRPLSHQQPDAITAVNEQAICSGCRLRIRCAAPGMGWTVTSVLLSGRQAGGRSAPHGGRNCVGLRRSSQIGARESLWLVGRVDAYGIRPDMPKWTVTDCALTRCCRNRVPLAESVSRGIG